MAGRSADSTSAKDGCGAAAFRVQNQIRQNAQDMQEYLADLGSWEKSIKKKDRRISRKDKGSTTPSSRTQLGATETPSIRRSGGTVSVRAGPPPHFSKAKKKDGRDLPRRNISEDGRGADRGGGEAAQEKRTGEKQGTAATGASAAGHTHDKGYNKWAKFDIDAAIRSVDTEDETANDKRVASNSSDSETDDNDETATEAHRLTPATIIDRSCRQNLQREKIRSYPVPPSPPPSPTLAPTKKGVSITTVPRDLEKEERERGNAKFAQGDFEGAAKCYTRCLGMKSQNMLAFSNRAMAHLKLKEFGKAEVDSNAALRLDPRHIKSLQRRAAARNALGKHRAALGDLQTAAELDSSSKQVRKDLNKTLETLRTVVRRAPKILVTVESEPLPAPKPHGYSPSTNTGQEDLPPRPASWLAAATDTRGVATATSTNAPATVGKETMAPFSSVLGQKLGSLSGGIIAPPEARTTVEELPDDTGALTTPTPPPSLANGESKAPASSLSTAPIVLDHGRDCVGGDLTAGSPVQVDGNELRSVYISSEAAVSTHPPEVTGATTETVTSAPVAVPGGPKTVTKQVVTSTLLLATAAATFVAAPATPSPILQAEDAVVTEADQLENPGGSKDASRAPREDSDNSPEMAHPAGEKAAALSSVKGKQESTKDSMAVRKARERPALPPASVAVVSGGSAQTQPRKQHQPPTTGYQFEHMWRSTEGLLETRLELLRTIPPSSISKIFRRTPLEVELLDGILEHLERAFLPRRPATALKWLKNLSKASRFGMTLALLGEGGGRTAVRKLLLRLEVAPSAKVDSEDVQALTNIYLKS